MKFTEYVKIGQVYRICQYGPVYNTDRNKKRWRQEKEEVWEKKN